MTTDTAKTGYAGPGSPAPVATAARVRTCRTPAVDRKNRNADRAARRVMSLIAIVQSWAEQRADRVSKARVSLGPEDYFEIEVAGRQTAYDFDLSGELTEFAVELVRSGYAVDNRLVPAAVPFGDGNPDRPTITLPVAAPESPGAK